MNVSVDRLKTNFISRMEDQYNTDHYFIESCYNENRYSKEVNLKDLALQIIFEEGNYTYINGCKTILCTGKDKDDDAISVIHIKAPEKEKIISNTYIVDDTWEETQW